MVPNEKIFELSSMPYYRTERLEKALQIHSLGDVQYSVQFPNVNCKKSLFGCSEVEVETGFKTEHEAQIFAQEKIEQIRKVASKVETPPSIKDNGFTAMEVQGYLVDSEGKKIIDCVKGCSILN